MSKIRGLSFDAGTVSEWWGNTALEWDYSVGMFGFKVVSVMAINATIYEGGCAMPHMDQYVSVTQAKAQLLDLIRQ
ncbi:MAG: hypothetical protein AB7T38_15025 [Nitrospirales bacterium]